MAQYKKNTIINGKWANKSELFNNKVKQAKIVSETNPEPSNYPDAKGNSQTQDVCKCQFEGINEAMKVSLNQATINVLVDVFGEDSKNWQNHTFELEIDKLPGKKFPLYLIPNGYKRIEDDNGYSLIVKINNNDGVDKEPNDEIDEKSLPF